MNIHKQITWRFLFLIACWFFCCSNHCLAAEQNAQTVRIAFPYQQGMSGLNMAGKLTGYNYDYMESLTEFTGWKVEYITFDDMSEDEAIMAAIEMVQNGEADLLGTMLKSDALEEMFDFPEKNYGLVYTTLSTSETSSITEMNYFTMKPLRVAVYKEATTRNREVEDFLDSIGADYEFILCGSQDEQTECVESGKADVLSSVSLNPVVGMRTVASFAQRPFYFAATKGKTQLLSELDAAITAIDHVSPYYQKELQDKYFGSETTKFVLTETEKQVYQELGRLHVLCVSNDAPYVFLEKDGTPTGMIVAILEDFADEVGLELEYSTCDSSEDITELLKNNQYDCVIGMPISSSICADTGMVHSYPITSSGLVTVRKDTMTKTPEESTIGTYKYLGNLASLGNYKDVVLFGSTAECLDAVRKGKVDLCCGDRSIVEYYNYESMQSLITTSMVGNSQDICIAFSKELGIDFLTGANNYIRSIDNITKSAYLSEANYHLQHNALAHFMHTQPVLAAFILVLACSLVLISVFLGITAKRRKQRNKELSEANAAKTDFLARMTHDIRTPMNAIIGLTALSLDEKDLSPQIKENLTNIHGSGEFLLGLVDDILDMSKIEAGAVKLKMEPYSYTDFLAKLKAMFQPQCEAKNIDFVFAEITVSTQILTDKLRLDQIFFNILSNAVKFTPEGGRISYSTANIMKDEEYISADYIIEDNGIGMSQEYMKRLFQPFEQEDKKYSSNLNGSGLGLSIAKNLTELMGGTIKVESQEGVGTRVTIHLGFTLCPDEVQHETVLLEQKTPAEEILKGKHILLVEDHPLNAQIAKKILEKKGILVIHAENGKIAVDDFNTAVESYFDAILMDIRMPIMDGLEATKAIRKLKRHDAATVPIIAMSANAYEEDVQKSLAAGMNDHLAKPVEPEQLYETLVKHIQGGAHHGK